MSECFRGNFSIAGLVDLFTLGLTMFVLSRKVTGFGFIVLVAGPGGGIQNSWKPAGQRPRPFLAVLAHDTWRAFARTTSGRRSTIKAAWDVGCGLECGQCCESTAVGWQTSSWQVS